MHDEHKTKTIEAAKQYAEKIFREDCSGHDFFHIRQKSLQKKTRIHEIVYCRIST